ncbi:uncharacterized protein LOC109841488 [Asparagus officinalis]|uniref:uncharacterized protein LOC109841488 n=1 Tax=Asparagus officinalis TaxID=4686 RepID=UPI00098DFB93|nr:uncharacterized protein LOC109841488 [Asparagus officinalis]
MHPYQLDTKIEGEQKTNNMPYKIAKEEAKKAVTKAKNKAFGDMYEELDTKEGEKVLFRLDNMRERSSKDLNQVRSIKDEEGQVLVEETDIKLRWRRYFDKLLNEAREGNGNREEDEEGPDYVGEPIWVYAWEVNYGSYSLAKEIEGTL